MATHIVAVAPSLDNPGVRSKLLRVTVACAAFVVGVLVGTVHRYVQQQRSAAQVEAPAPSPKSAPVPGKIHPAYPEDLGIGPREIAFFIEEHPEANLDRLWQRLGVTDDDDPVAQFSFSQPCGLCKANIFEYNLDNDAGGEDFLTYNRAELRAIAAGTDSEKKAWLKEFLGMCENSAFKRELLALLN